MDRLGPFAKGAIGYSSRGINPRPFVYLMSLLGIVHSVDVRAFKVLLLGTNARAPQRCACCNRIALVGRHSSQVFLIDLLVIYVLIRLIFIVTYIGRSVLYLETL